MYRILEERKKEMKQKGWFDRKRKIINSYCQNIGLVTARNSAAETDVISTFKRKNNHTNIFISYCRVQGNNCHEDICKSISILQKKCPFLDAILLCRGGGSDEDLSIGFNHDDVVKTIYESQIPIVTGIGHEKDITLASLVSDINFATPSLAADYLAFNVHEYLSEIDRLILETNRLYDEKQKINLEKIKYDLRNQLKNNCQPLLLIQKQKNELNQCFLDLEKYFVLKKNKMIHSLSLYRKKQCNIYLRGRIQNYFHIIQQDMQSIQILQENKVKKDKEYLHQMNKQLSCINLNCILKKGFTLLRDNKGNIIKNMEHLKKIHSFHIIFLNESISIYEFII